MIITILSSNSHQILLWLQTLFIAIIIRTNDDHCNFCNFNLLKDLLSSFFGQNDDKNEKIAPYWWLMTITCHCHMTPKKQWYQCRKWLPFQKALFFGSVSRSLVTPPLSTASTYGLEQRFEICLGVNNIDGNISDDFELYFTFNLRLF